MLNVHEFICCLRKQFHQNVYVWISSVAEDPNNLEIVEKKAS